MTVLQISEQFIRENTRALSPPLVPEVLLCLAEKSLPIWQKTEEELGEIGLPPPYWAFAWAGGQALARYLLDNPMLVKDKRVVDLGSGSGIAAIAAMKAGAARVLAADVDAVALTAIAINARINRVSVEVTRSDLLSAQPSACEVLLIGDLFYECAGREGAQPRGGRAAPSAGPFWWAIRCATTSRRQSSACWRSTRCR